MGLDFETYKYPIYLGSAVVLYSSYLLMCLGIYVMNPIYLNILSDIFHVGVCVFLMIRFNPMTRYISKPHDKDIVFGAAMLLLFNVLFFDVGVNYRAWITELTNM